MQVDRVAGRDFGGVGLEGVLGSSVERSGEVRRLPAAELLRDPYTGDRFRYTHQDGRCIIESESLSEDNSCACVKRFAFPPERI